MKYRLYFKIKYISKLYTHYTSHFENAFAHNPHIWCAGPTPPISPPPSFTVAVLIACPACFKWSKTVSTTGHGAVDAHTSNKRLWPWKRRKMLVTSMANPSSNARIVDDAELIMVSIKLLEYSQENGFKVIFVATACQLHPCPLCPVQQWSIMRIMHFFTTQVTGLPNIFMSRCFWYQASLHLPPCRPKC